MDIKLLNIIMGMARRMTKVGAEISRVEESLKRICIAYGCKSCEVYATTSQLVVTVHTENDEFLTLQKRVGATGTDIEKLDKLNSLVRKITAETPTLNEIETMLRDIDNTKSISKKLLPLFYGVIAASFCLFFGSRSLAEMLVSFVIGIVVGVLSVIFETAAFNKILARFLCSLTAAFTVRLFISVDLVQNPDYIIIGNIMSLIPGIGLTNALRDLFCGDMITGILRSIEALLLTVAIALGFALPTLIFGGGF